MDSYRRSGFVRISLVGAATLAFFALSCGDSAFSPDPEPGQYVLQVSVTATEIEAGDSTLVQAVIADASGRPVPEATAHFQFTWTASDPALAHVAGTGPAAVVHALGAGEVDIGIEATRLAGSQGAVSQGAMSGGGLRSKLRLRFRQKQTNLRISSGNGQQGRAGGGLANPLRVQLTGTSGQPVAGAPINWNVSGGGSITPSAITTDSSGHASASWTLGPATGTQTASARHGAQESAFTATVTAAAAAQVIRVSGDAQSAPAATPLPDSLVVRVLDEYGNNVPGATVTWSVTSGGGSVTPAQGNTSALGIARAAWTLGDTTGGGSVRADVAGAGSAVFTATARDVSAPPPPPAVASVVVTPATLALDAIGAQGTLAATAYNSDNQAVPGISFAWTTLNSGIVSVDTAGRVTARGLGTVLIIAAAVCCDGADTTTVTVTQRVARLTVAPRTLSLQAGGAGDVTVVAHDANGNLIVAPAVTWSSSAPTVATVSQGHVTAGAAGTAVIRAVSGAVRDSAVVTVQSPTPQVSSVVVTPSSGSLDALGAQLSLSAVAYDANNQVVPNATMRWSTLNSSIATVDSMGRVTARGVGTALIVATALCCSEADTTGIDVTQRVASLELLPSTLSLDVGDAGTLAVTARDANQNVISAPSVTWSSSSSAVATVTAGQVTAVSSGSAVIRAASGDGRDSTMVTVATATPPPSSNLANECATPSQAWIWCDDFSQDRLSSYFEYDNAGGQFVRAAAVGVAGTSGMRATFGAGQSNAGSLKLAFGRTPDSYFSPVDAGTADYRDVYWRMYVRNAPGWTGGGGDKLSRGIVFANSSWAEAAIGHVWTSGTGNNFLMLDPASGTDAQGNLQTTQYNDFNNLRWLGGSVGTTPLFNSASVGQWHCVEAHMRLNDAGQSNGIFEMWINGSLDARSIGLNWLGSYNAYGINSVFFENFWNAGSPQQQSRFIDNIVVSTQRVGCGDTGSTPPPPAPVATVAISPTSPAVAVGGTVQLTATLRDANNNVLTGRSVSWSSGSTLTATVNSSGLVTGLLPGNAVITATSEGQSRQVTVTVTATPPSVSSVTVTPGSATRTAPNGTVQLTAAGLDAGGNVVTGVVFNWSSSDTGVATVNSTGLVLVKGVGTAVITATAVCCGAQGSANITGTGTGTSVPASIVEDFTSYTSTAHMLSDPRNLYAGSGDFYANEGGANTNTGGDAGEIHLDTNVQYGGHPTMRYQWYASGPAMGGTISRMLKLDALTPKEVWVEVAVRFSSNFRISNNYSGSGAYKFLFMMTAPSDRRFHIAFENGDSGNLGFTSPSSGGGIVMVSGPNMSSMADGQWHIVRWYAGPTGMRSYFDGQLVLNETGHSGGWDHIYGISLGKNINQQPLVQQTLHWGEVRVWADNNPGW